MKFDTMPAATLIARSLGEDMDIEVNPYEVGLGWMVNMKKGPFIGRGLKQWKFFVPVATCTVLVL